MKWKSRKREAERRLDNLEERDTEGLAREREHKLYVGVDLGKLPGTEAALEKAAEAPTVHLTEDGEAAEDAVEDAARVIGMDPEDPRPESHE